jgi:ubiquitin C-terminal hydrolase
MAVVRHEGATAAEGHYVCDVCDVAASHCTWLRHNDSVVTELLEATVLEDQESPYILFYVATELAQ